MKKFLLVIILCLWSGIAFADFRVKTGQITSPTSTGSTAFTGVGFQPKAIILYTTMTNSFTGANGMFGFGAGKDSTHRWATSIDVDDSNFWGGVRNYKSTQVISIYNNTGNGTGTLYLEGDLVSLDSDGFTINFTTVQASGKVINYIAFGGTDINVAVDTLSTTSGTGTKSATGLGFQPTFVLLSGVGLGSSTQAANPSLMIGVASSTTKRGVACLWQSQDTNTRAKGIQVTDNVVYRMSSSSAGDPIADFSSFDSDGFTLNFSTNSGARWTGYFAINGVPATVGTLTQPTSTGNQSVTGLGMRPDIVGFISKGGVSSASITGNPNILFGSAVSASAQTASVFGTQNDGGLSSNVGISGSVTKSILSISHTTTTSAAGFLSQDLDGFTLNWSTADATAREVIYWALGNPAHLNNINNATVNNATIN